MTDAPERIYLQVCHDEQCNEPFGAQAHDDISWCQDKINEGDVAYVRADKFDALAERADALYTELRDLCVGKSGCVACRASWLVGEAERHIPGCLAAPGAPKEGTA